MESERDSELSPASEQNAAREHHTEQPKPIRSSRKTLLVAATVSVITIITLVMWRGQIDGLRDETGVINPTVTSSHESPTNMRITETTPTIGDLSKTITRAIDGLTEQIRQWFDSAMAEQSDMSHELTALASNVSAMNESIVELHKGNEELLQRIAATQSQLQTIANDIRRLKTTTKKVATTQRQSLVSAPPFQIDAIDIWDDAVYVAVSHEGHIAFLREGQRQAGWQVVQIDRLQGQVVLRGPDGQDHSVTLRR